MPIRLALLALLVLPLLLVVPVVVASLLARCAMRAIRVRPPR